MDTGSTVDILIERIITMMELRKFDEAFVAVMEGLSKWPEEPRLHSLLGACHEKLDNNKQAIKAFEEAVRLDPEYLEARERLCLLYHREHKEKEAEFHMEACLKMGSAEASVHALASLVYMERNPFKSEKHLKEALRLDPDDEMVRYAESYNALMSLKLGTFKKFLTRKMEEDPTSAGAMFGMGVVELSRRKWANAESLLRQSYVLEPDEGKMDAWIDARIGKYFPFNLTIPLGWISYPFSLGFQMVGYIIFLILLVALPMSQYEEVYDKWLWPIYVIIAAFLSLTYILKYPIQYFYRRKHHPETASFYYRDFLKLTLFLCTTFLWLVILNKNYNFLMTSVFLLIYVMIWPLVKERKSPITRSVFAFIYGLSWLSFLLEIARTVFQLDLPNWVSAPAMAGWLAIMLLLNYVEDFEDP